MATHSSVLAWRIPGTGEPGGLSSMGSHRVGHDWSDLAVVVVLNIYSSKWILQVFCQNSTLPLTVLEIPGSISLAVVLEKTLESPLDCKEIQPVNPKGNQPWILIGRTDAEAETPIIWPPDAKSQLIRKDPNAGKDWRWEEKGTTEDEVVKWHHWLNGQEFEQTPGNGEGQGSLTCCSPWGRKELDTTEWLNWTELKLRPKEFNNLSKIIPFELSK